MTPDSLRIANLEESFAKMDSIIAAQQDSMMVLAEKVHHFQISEGYFQSILNAQLGTFSIVITSVFVIIGLLTWGIVKLEVNKVRKKIYRKILVFEDRIDKSIKRSDYYEYHINNSLMYQCEYSRAYITAISWALRNCLSNYLKDKVDVGNSLLEQCEFYLSKMKLIDAKFKQKDMDIALDDIKQISKIDGININKLDKIKKELILFYYNK